MLYDDEYVCVSPVNPLLDVSNKARDRALDLVTVQKFRLALPARLTVTSDKLAS
jgi:hypothetical protein